MVGPPRARNCTAGSFGYNAGPGYDLATGLGSVDAAKLIAAWSAGTVRGIPSMVLSANTDAITKTDSVILTATVSSSNGATPLGTVTFYLGSTALGTTTLAGSGGAST